MRMKLKLLLLLLLFIPLSVNAATVSLDCPSVAKKGTNIICRIKLDSNDMVAGFETSISASNSLIYQSYSKIEGWSGTSSSSKFLVYGNEVSGTGKTLGTYTYAVDTSASGNLTVTLNDIIVSDTNGEPLPSNTTVTDTIKVASSVNTLSSLNISAGAINFSSTVTTYNVTVNASTITISATATDSHATVSGTGKKTLKHGANKFEIIVTAEDGSKKTYTINVTRPDNRSSNNKLNSLTLSEVKINFDKNKTDYEISVKNDISEIKIDGKAEDNKSKVEGLGTKKLNVGKNIFVIKVIAENESVTEYKVVVIRGQDELVTDNNIIKNIIITGYDIKFNPTTKEYIIKTNEKKLDIKVELENSESNYEIIGNEDLRDRSVVQIVVTNKDGSTNIYSIIIENPNVTNLGNTKYKGMLYIIIIMIFMLGILIFANAYLLVMQLKKIKNSV